MRRNPQAAIPMRFIVDRAAMLNDVSKIATGKRRVGMKNWGVDRNETRRNIRNLFRDPS